MKGKVINDLSLLKKGRARFFKSRTGWLIFVSATGLCLYLMVAAFVSARNETNASAIKPVAATGMGKSPGRVMRAETSGQSQLINRGRLWPKLRQTLKTIGDRLEKQGKERLIMIGTLSRGDIFQAKPHPFRLITEFPGNMRLEEQAGIQGNITVYNGQDGLTTNGSLSRPDQDLIETLTFDTLDHFFSGQMQGFGTRALGERFRLDDGAASNYADGFYDIYHVSDQIGIGQSTREQPKLYYINSDTLLLDRVRYDIDHDGTLISVEVLLTNWRNENGQLLPHSIVRTENGQRTLELTIDMISIRPGVKDGIFDRP